MKENLIGENFRPQVLRGVGVKVVLRGGLEGDGTLECREEGGGPEVTCDERKWPEELEGERVVVTMAPVVAALKVTSIQRKVWLSQQGASAARSKGHCGWRVLSCNPFQKLRSV